jgi:hypothetical protein
MNSSFRGMTITIISTREETVVLPEQNSFRRRTANADF